MAAVGHVRQVQATTGTHTVTVSEPSMWEPPREIKPPLYGFDVEIKEHDL